MFAITVLDDYQDVVRRLGATRLLAGLDVTLSVRTDHLTTESALVEALRDTDCLVLIRERTRLSAAVLSALPRLKLIVQTGRQSQCIDLDACKRLGIQVRDGTGNAIAPAELTWALILAASRRLVPYARQLGLGHWQHSTDRIEDEQLGRSLHGRTLGVWGLGRIGLRVARIGAALGMKIVAHGREQSMATAKAEGFAYLSNRFEFLAAVDVLTLHLRLTPETCGLITARDLGLMRPDALLVNTSRSELIAADALIEALGAGRPGAAALDVFDGEPDGVKAFIGHPNILCTPHLGFVECDTYESYFGEAFAHIRDFVENRRRPVTNGETV